MYAFDALIYSTTIKCNYESAFQFFQTHPQIFIRFEGQLLIITREIIRDSPPKFPEGLAELGVVQVGILIR